MLIFIIQIQQMKLWHRMKLKNLETQDKIGPGGELME